MTQEQITLYKITSRALDDAEINLESLRKMQSLCNGDNALFINCGSYIIHPNREDRDHILDYLTAQYTAKVEALKKELEEI